MRGGGAQSTSSFLITQQGDAKLPSQLGVSLSPEPPVSLLHHPLAPERRTVGTTGQGWSGQTPLGKLFTEPALVYHDWILFSLLGSFAGYSSFYKENTFLLVVK